MVGHNVKNPYANKLASDFRPFDPDILNIALFYFMYLSKG